MTLMPYSEAAADKAVNFFNRVLVHTKGKWAGVPFDLRPWQEQEIIRPLFGTLNDAGLRQYRTAYVEVPRKNGKSEVAAGVALYLLTADGEEGAEIYGAAADRDQAGIVFQVAAEMVRRSRVLSKQLRVIDSQKRIVHPRSGSFYRAIPADAAGSHGFNAHGIVFDELHTQASRELWDVLTTSTGAREQPLTFAITTAGYDRNSICWEQHEYAQKVASGVVDDPSFFAFLRFAPDAADWTDEAVWRACNPALGDFRGLEEMRTFAAKARETPALENTFRQLYLNQWVKQAVRWLALEKWDATAGRVEPAALRGRAGYGGLDLASTTDIAAWVLVFPADDGTFDVLPHFWIPEEGMRERVRRDRVPYDLWERQGFLTATPGAVIDYGAIEEHILRDRERFNIREIAFDRWGATQLSQRLDGEGFTVIPFGQGYASMSSPTKELLNKVLERKLRHGGNPVLRWMADNMVVRRDPAGNLKPDKERSTEKIDGMVALVMALDRAIRNQHGPSVYEERGLRVV